MNSLDFKRLVDRQYVLFRLKGTPLEDLSKESMDDIFLTLREQDRELLLDFEEQYGFAGKTAVNVFEGKGFPDSARDPDTFASMLQSYIDSTTPGLLKGNEIPYGRPMRPSLDSAIVPVVNLVKRREDGFLIQLVTGIPSQVPDGWDVRTTIRPSFETVIVRLTNPIFVEIRSSFRMCSQYLSIIANVVGAKPGEITWLPLTKISEKEAERIAVLLDAGLVEADHLGSGIYGRKSVAAAQGVDLRKEDEYKDEYKGMQYLSQTMNVKYTDSRGFTCNVSFKVLMHGGFEFKSKVSESIITSVMDAFVQVRYIERIDQSSIG